MTKASLSSSFEGDFFCRKLCSEKSDARKQDKGRAMYIYEAVALQIIIRHK